MHIEKNAKENHLCIHILTLKCCCDIGMVYPQEYLYVQYIAYDMYLVGTG